MVAGWGGGWGVERARGGRGDVGDLLGVVVGVGDVAVVGAIEVGVGVAVGVGVVVGAIVGVGEGGVGAVLSGIRDVTPVN